MHCQTAMWQVEEGRGRWRDFPAHLNEAVEDHFNREATGNCLQYVWEVAKGTYITYTIDFATMTQYRMEQDATDAVASQRKIRRVLLG